ncbi:MULTISPECIES: GNAT family N-acetyltransferase [Sphingobium]|jgi:acetyltransferase|uniref:N-acetyltransferase domain-containing protein n=2 Tax=Sphingobium yanoikuyae TaxID=13690 RepID=K9DF51_SPHYA|nr:MULTISPECIES: GNAT family N-acetyltransferase [Sphingobium]EKU76140.1 hypothetical protein HMPREF9718_01492 [Sphingobium yanoikuyae ATCC 51230]MBR2270083.1 GNAT family N-acetyltransferase [Sphingobium sp.]PHP20035.1 GNAT family N-acetyltransferase [Sphingobium sp. IP1]RSU60843.1 GNAT family N-acetyltransferase [Sphingobium yanoikuyae]WIA57708.1 GNAT family N-acetyltransferase [Sphingobium sp. WTD-1]
MTDKDILETRTGIRVQVRPAQDGDARALAHFFSAVSDDDRRFRFLSSAPGVSAGQIHDLIHGDPDNCETFLATDEKGAILAAATLAADPDRTRAEVAISVRADHRGKGVGWSMLRHATDRAQEMGVGLLQAIESRANHAAIELEREQGFVARSVDDEPSLLILEKRF